MGKLRLFIFGLICILTISGCFLGNGPKERKGESATPISVSTPSPDLEHKITYPGETLALISKWYTGSVDNWRKIADANPGLKPNAMKLGTVIKIPKGLVTNRRVPSKKDIVVKIKAIPSPPSPTPVPSEVPPEPLPQADPQSESATVPAVEQTPVPVVEPQASIVSPEPVVENTGTTDVKKEPEPTTSSEEPTEEQIKYQILQDILNLDEEKPN